MTTAISPPARTTDIDVPDWLDWIEPSSPLSPSQSRCLYGAWVYAAVEIAYNHVPAATSLEGLPCHDTDLLRVTAGVLHVTHFEQYEVDGGLVMYGVLVPHRSADLVRAELKNGCNLLADGVSFDDVRATTIRHLTRNFDDMNHDDMNHDTQDFDQACTTLEAMLDLFLDTRPRILLRAAPSRVSSAFVTYARFAPEVLEHLWSRSGMPAVVLPACLARQPMGLDAGPLLVTDTPDVLLLAVGLWDPGGSGELASPRAAVTAARSVLHLPDVSPDTD